MFRGTHPSIRHYVEIVKSVSCAKVCGQGALPVRLSPNRAYTLGKSFNTNVTAKTAPTAPLSSKATARQDLRKNYQRDGYVVVKNLFSSTEVTQLADEIVAIARGRYGEFEGYSPANGQLKDNEVVAKYSRIEFPHKISPNLYGVALAHPRVVEVLNALIGPNVKCMNSKLYIDGPGERGRVWHQDESVIPTRDRSLLCAIVAIDDHTVDNGCPLMHPGSHKSGVIFRLRQPGQVEPLEDVACVSNQTEVETESDRNEEDSERSFDMQSEAYDVSRSPNAGVPIELTAGSVVFVNGYTLQRMLPNTSPYVMRRALKAHYCSAESWLPWSMDGKVPLTPDNRDIVMISGKDPYEYKGITNYSTPHAHLRTPST